MATTTLIIAFALLYLGVGVAVMWVCVFADPETSPTAQFWTEKLPRKISEYLRRVLGSKSLSVLEFFADRALSIFYLVIVCGAWSIILTYVYPWVDRQSSVPSYHKLLGYVVFAASILSWRLASTSSPGIITAKTLHRYDHFPYDDLLYVSDRKCSTKGIPRLARSKYDRFKYDNNIPRFDHFCGWVNNTIGEENYRFFLLFLFVQWAKCVYGANMIYLLFLGEIRENKLFEVVFFNRFTGEELESNYYIVFQFLFNKYTFEAAVFLLMSVMAVALGLFLLYHIYLTSVGMTTNESYKWSDVRKWHKSELKRYNDAIKKGEAGVASASNKQRAYPVVGDGDVTCTPGTGGGSAVSDVTELADAVQDPGPFPKNIYNRGFVENWKEVIFPISLRKTASTNFNVKRQQPTVDKPKAT